MKPSRNDMLIDRYLDRRMSMQEERVFVARLDADARLRAMVETERAIRASMRAERASLTVSHASRRAALLETLAATAPAQQTGTTLLAGLLGSTFVKGLGGLLVIGVVVALFGPSVWGPRSASVGTPAADTSRTAVAPHMTPAAIENGVGGANTVSTVNGREPHSPAVEHSAARRDVRAMNAQRGGGGSAARPTNVNAAQASERQASSVPAAKPDHGTPPDQPQKPELRTTSPRAPIVFRADSVRTRVRVETSQP